MTAEQEKVIRYLKQPFYLDNKINALTALKIKNEAIACKCTANYENDGKPNTSDENRIETAIHKIIDINAKITAEIDKLVDIREDIRNMISKINNPDLEAVLINRYLNYYTVEQTAEIMNYSITTVKSKHNHAIKKLSEIVLF